MEINHIILNYTGKRVGVTNESGNPITVLPFHGNARVDRERKKSTSAGRVAIYDIKYSRVEGLPEPDLNLEKLYIVTKEVAEAFGISRKDLLIAEDPIKEGGMIYYRKLSRMNW